MLLKKTILILCNIFGHAYSLSRLLNIKSNLILTNFIIGSLSIMTSIQGIIWFSIFEESELSAEKYLNEVIEFIIIGFKK